MKFEAGNIQGVIKKNLRKYTDHRGWLIEIFRSDEIEKTSWPAMSYISQTEPGIARGPHGHKDQTDYFVFIGPADFKVFLWDYRNDSPTFGKKMIFSMGENNPGMVVIPPGVVHAYKNTGSVPGWVINLPNRLYAGEKRCEPVDEVRYEDMEESVFKLE